MATSSSRDELFTTANSFGYKVPEKDEEEYASLLASAGKTFQTIWEMDDYQPEPDMNVVPRVDIHFPEKKDNPYNGWAWKFTATHKNPSSDLLKGKTFCIKDNVSVAGVPCLLGTESFTDWIPKTDATVITRILEAGGTIIGKAVCENLSRGAVSATAATGPVDNPYAAGYSAGGSSSGTAALVGGGVADMGIGCDQGGSIRIPAGLCGLYGFKATTGLVPYTGIASNDASVDYVGPMSRTLMENAAFLEAIAGVDGLDDRQIAGTPFRPDVPKYTKILEETKEQGVKGLKIGLLKEGLTSAALNPDVEKKFRAAVAVFEELGATVEEVSIPIHEPARAIYSVMSKLGNHMGMMGKATGRRQVMLTDLMEKKNLPYTQEAYEKMSTFSREGLLAGAYGWEKYPYVYAKAVNLSRKLRDAYDEAFSKYDLLVMPTTVTPSDPLPPVDATPLEAMSKSNGKLENTSPFNASGHPALAMPIGFVPAKDDPSIKLPTSLQIVGKFWDEPTILRAAYAWESAKDWKNF